MGHPSDHSSGAQNSQVAPRKSAQPHSDTISCTGLPHMPTGNLYNPHTLTVLHKQNKNEVSDLSYTLHLLVVCVGPHGKAIPIHA